MAHDEELLQMTFDNDLYYLVFILTRLTKRFGTLKTFFNFPKVSIGVQPILATVFFWKMNLLSPWGHPIKLEQYRVD